MRRIHALFLSLVAIMLAGMVCAPVSYGREYNDPTQGLKIGLDGKVINNKTRKPVGKAKIQLVGTNQKTKSKSNGMFRLANIGRGHKELKITAKGYQPEIEKINRGKDMNLYITIRLFPKKSGKK